MNPTILDNPCLNLKFFHIRKMVRGEGTAKSSYTISHLNTQETDVNYFTNTPSKRADKPLRFICLNSKTRQILYLLYLKKIIATTQMLHNQ